MKLTIHSYDGFDYRYKRKGVPVNEVNTFIVYLVGHRIPTSRDFSGSICTVAMLEVKKHPWKSLQVMLPEIKKKLMEKRFLESMRYQAYAKQKLSWDVKHNINDFVRRCTVHGCTQKLTITFFRRFEEYHCKTHGKIHITA